MRALVTGASGFIGGVLCGQLLERGHDVTALVRRAGSGPAGTHGSERKVREVNVAGTQRLLDACRGLADGGGVGEAAADGGAVGGPRIVFASTVVTGDARGALLTEDQPLPVQTPYGRSKQEGERLVLASGLPAVVIRPSHVYGPGGWYANELIAHLRQPGRFAVIGSGANLWDVVHVDDVASALVLAGESAAPGSIYHVADDEPISFYDFMALTAEALGLGAPRRIPAALARLVAGGNAVAAAVRSARSSNAKIKRELGWQPRFASAREGVVDAVARLPSSQPGRPPRPARG
ncbi:MAG: NAD-dependent epimerase/dehydratase family protein [Solirubrobacteraceae bacterium]